MSDAVVVLLERGVLACGLVACGGERRATADTDAATVRSDQPLSQQADAVRRFFERAAAALRGMAGTATIQ